MPAARRAAHGVRALMMVERVPPTPILRAASVFTLTPVSTKAGATHVPLEQMVRECGLKLIDGKVHT